MSPPKINGPIAAAHLLLSEGIDDTRYKHETLWLDIDFKMVDVLYIGPLGIQKDGSFDIATPYVTRFQ
jgi:hypothetical protein